MFAFDVAVNYPVGLSPIAIVAADFNNDTVQDLAVVNNGSSDVSVLLGNSDGTFRPALNSPVGGNALSLAVGDFDDDGNMDLTTANSYDLSVLLGDGQGSFEVPTSHGVAGNPQSVAVGDFNGDGLLDLGATSNVYNPGYYYGYYYGYYDGYANVLLGDGGGGFSAPNSTYLGYGFHNSALAADLNGDEYDDFAAFQPYGYVVVLLGDDSGTLQGPTSFIYTGDYSYALAAGDVDGDGDNDLVAANYYGSSVGVMLGDGGGGFSSPISYATGGNTTSVVLGDFTNDGNLDVLAGNYNQVAVLHGNGDGTFSLPKLSATGTNTRGVAAGDFNGDGWLDAAAANAGNNNVSVLINDQTWPIPVPPQVTIDDVVKNEGKSGTTSFSFIVHLSEPSSQTVTVNFATANGTATTGDSDYIANAGSVTFAPGVTTATITVFVRGDKRKEASETFFVNLTGATNGVIADSKAMGTITNDDGGKGNGKGRNASLVAALLADDSLTPTKKRK